MLTAWLTTMMQQTVFQKSTFNNGQKLLFHQNWRHKKRYQNPNVSCSKNTPSTSAVFFDNIEFFRTSESSYENLLTQQVAENATRPLEAKHIVKSTSLTTMLTSLQKLAMQTSTTLPLRFSHQFLTPR